MRNQTETVEKPDREMAKPAITRSKSEYANRHNQLKALTIGRQTRHFNLLEAKLVDTLTKLVPETKKGRKLRLLEEYKASERNDRKLGLRFF